MAVTATVTPGKQLAEGEVATRESLNLMARPTVDVSGTVSGLALSDGSVTNVKVAAGADIAVGKIAATSLALKQFIRSNSSGDGVLEAAGSMSDGDIIVADATDGPIVVTPNNFAVASGTGDISFTAGTLITADLADDAVTLAKMAAGTDGNIISYDASGNPVAVATGTSGHVLTSAGAGAPPTFTDIVSTATAAANVKKSQLFQSAASTVTFTPNNGSGESWETGETFNTSNVKAENLIVTGAFTTIAASGTLLIEAGCNILNSTSLEAVALALFDKAFTGGAPYTDIATTWADPDQVTSGKVGYLTVAGSMTFTGGPGVVNIGLYFGGDITGSETLVANTAIGIGTTKGWLKITEVITP